MLLSTFLFLPFLPQWAQIALSIFTGLGGMGSVLALVKVRREKQDFLIAQATQKAKEEKDLEARLKDYKEFKEKYALDLKHTEDRMTGFNVAMEKVADKAGEDCKALETKIGNLQGLSNEVTKLQTTTDGTNSRVEKLEGSLEKLENRLNTRLDNLEKKTDDNARWQNSVLNEILLHLNGGGKRFPAPQS
ncbi:hypothetical protein Q5H92_14840 [Hymenobacter sp. M29]|uniref:Chromosome partition protein Smc n=1 Tax=Hymenobacter mellowenesis TaxID=3063995 RepID=A0ABT9ACS4_9BACT|nr:hypothetical protein [Hymenobacter sp. M29]MDO7847643.1 hypothetical protein [Hymenobacter sp. M29]